ncbi:MAG TPA: MarR family transcriptional regulator [Chloroflexota bacterium]
MTDTVTHHPAIAVDEDFEDEFPDARRAATLCAATLLRTANRLLAEIDRRRRSIADLSATGFEILAIVEGAGEPLTPHVIADRLLVTSGTMTSLLDTLERRGLIRRVPHPSDRRKLLIEITDEARTIVDRMLPRVHGASRDAFATLSDTECETLTELLERVQAQLRVLEQETRLAGDERRVQKRR